MENLDQAVGAAVSTIAVEPSSGFLGTLSLLILGSFVGLMCYFVKKLNN